MSLTVNNKFYSVRNETNTGWEIYEACEPKDRMIAGEIVNGLWCEAMLEWMNTLELVPEFDRPVADLRPYKTR